MKVSVIVPSYNYGHLISGTLDSVLKQSYKGWKCIAVDDGEMGEISFGEARSNLKNIIERRLI